MNELSPSKRNRAIVGGYQSLREDLARLSPDRPAPLILIKENVCRLLEARLREDGFNVLNAGRVHLLSKPWAPEGFSTAVRCSLRITIVQPREGSDGRAPREVIGLPRRRPPMRPEMFLPFLVGYGLAVRQCRAELMATQSWLRGEVAELRKELAAARAELERLRAAQRDPDATLN